MQHTEHIYSGPPLHRVREFAPITPLGWTTRYVYILRDAAGAPLYVGQSWNPQRRMEKHRRNKPWWPDVARMEILRVVGTNVATSDTAVAEAEMFFIRLLRPLHNKVGVPV